MTATDGPVQDRRPGAGLVTGGASGLGAAVVVGVLGAELLGPHPADVAVSFAAISVAALLAMLPSSGPLRSHSRRCWVPPYTAQASK